MKRRALVELAAIILTVVGVWVAALIGWLIFRATLAVSQ